MLRFVILSALAISTPLFVANAEPKSGKVGNSDNPVICKREVPIGSLIATRKICLTKSEWEVRSTRGNEEARRQVEDARSKDGPGN